MTYQEMTAAQAEFEAATTESEPITVDMLQVKGRAAIARFSKPATFEGKTAEEYRALAAGLQARAECAGQPSKALRQMAQKHLDRAAMLDADPSYVEPTKSSKQKKATKAQLAYRAGRHGVCLRCGTVHTTAQTAACAQSGS
jgi:hypothetical protein